MNFPTAELILKICKSLNQSGIKALRLNTILKMVEDQLVNETEATKEAVIEFITQFYHADRSGYSFRYFVNISDSIATDHYLNWLSLIYPYVVPNPDKDDQVATWIKHLNTDIEQIMASGASLSEVLTHAYLNGPTGQLNADNLGLGSTDDSEGKQAVNEQNSTPVNVNPPQVEQLLHREEIACRAYQQNHHTGIPGYGHGMTGQAVKEALMSAKSDNITTPLLAAIKYFKGRTVGGTTITYKVSELEMLGKLNAEQEKQLIADHQACLKIFDDLYGYIDCRQCRGFPPYPVNQLDQLSIQKLFLTHDQLHTHNILNDCLNYMQYIGSGTTMIQYCSHRLSADTFIGTFTNIVHFFDIILKHVNAMNNESTEEAQHDLALIYGEYDANRTIWQCLPSYKQIINNACLYRWYQSVCNRYKVTGDLKIFNTEPPLSYQVKDRVTPHMYPKTPSFVPYPAGPIPPYDSLPPQGCHISTKPADGQMMHAYLIRLVARYPDGMIPFLMIDTQFGLQILGINAIRFFENYGEEVIDPYRANSILDTVMGMSGSELFEKHNKYGDIYNGMASKLNQVIYLSDEPHHSLLVELISNNCFKIAVATHSATTVREWFLSLRCQHQRGDAVPPIARMMGLLTLAEINAYFNEQVALFVENSKQNSVKPTRKVNPHLQAFNERLHECMNSVSMLDMQRDCQRIGITPFIQAMVDDSDNPLHKHMLYGDVKVVGVNGATLYQPNPILPPNAPLLVFTVTTDTALACVNEIVKIELVLNRDTDNQITLVLELMEAGVNVKAGKLNNPCYLLEAFYVTVAQYTKA